MPIIPPVPRSQTWLLAVASSDTDNACRQSSTAGSAACKKTPSRVGASGQRSPDRGLQIGKADIRPPADLSQSREIGPRIGAQIMTDQRLPQYGQPQIAT